MNTAQEIKEELMDMIADSARNIQKEIEWKFRKISVVNWVENPFISVSTREEATLEPGEKSEIGFYLGIFEDDEDNRFIPLSRMVEIAIGSDELEIDLHKWDHVHKVISDAIKCQIKKEEDTTE